MSCYTSFYADISMLETPDRVNYEFDLSKFDVNKHIEISQGSQSIKLIKDPAMLANTFKNPRQLGIVIITCLAFVLMISLIVVGSFYFWFKFVTINEEKATQLKKVIFYSIGILLLLIFFYYIFNMVTLRANALVQFVKQKSEPKKS